MLKRAIACDVAAQLDRVRFNFNTNNIDDDDGDDDDEMRDEMGCDAIMWKQSPSVRVHLEFGTALMDGRDGYMAYIRIF